MTIRVLIVDDSRFFQRRVKEMLETNSRISVIGFADDGKEAIQKVTELSPDVITMDIEMPVMDGITAVKEIMALKPTPILMFSSLTTEGAQATLDALDVGAIDFIPKNFDDIANNRENVKHELCTKVIAVAKVNVLSGNARQSAVDSINKDEIGNRSAKNKKACKLVAIGTSTGGPVALQKILSHLPENFPLPIILIQHMPGSFTPAFAKRLDSLCDIHIKEATSGDKLESGTAYLAPGGCQMLISEGGVIVVTDFDEKELYNPCVDKTLLSAGKVFPGEILAIILTGMGADGCEGSKNLKLNGCEVWAQDEKSCVVFGMPGAIVEEGLADSILSIDNISEKLMSKFQ